MRKLLWIALTLLVSGCGGPAAKVNALMEEELQETNNLYKIFKGVNSEKSFDYAVAAMEQPCTRIAHLQKEREQLVSKMNPSQIRNYEDSEQFKALNQATAKMVNALFDARNFIPDRRFEIDEVWRKAGLPPIVKESRK